MHLLCWELPYLCPDLPQPLTQILVARLVILKGTNILVNNILGLLNLTCVWPYNIALQFLNKTEEHHHR